MPTSEQPRIERNTPVKVLIIDQSMMARHLLTTIINEHPNLEVVGTASDPYIARNRIKSLNPDVLTLDVELPRMNGLQFLTNIMRLRPMPVVMISSLTTRGATESIEAMRIGAIDVIAKPDFASNTECFTSFSNSIYEKLLFAADTPKEKLTSQSSQHQYLNSGHPEPDSAINTQTILALGASTGGTIALQEVLTKLPATTPGTVIVQHIPGQFSRSFSESLNRSCAMTVKQAEHGDMIKHGHVYIAPGTEHLEIVRENFGYRCRLHSSEPVNRHRPSVDVLFHSVAKHAPNTSVGVILTGMGKDGASGLLAMREKGCVTIAQDKASSVVWGMPGSAVKINAAQYIQPLHTIPEIITTSFASTTSTLLTTHKL